MHRLATRVLTLEFRAKQAGTERNPAALVYVKVVKTIAPTDAVEVELTLPAGAYTVQAKANHWLRRVARSVQVSGANVSGVKVSLVNGDIDGDNEVTLVDFGALVAAFGSVPGDSNWNPDADLDGNGEVTLLDFGVLVRNFGQTGDE